MSRYLCGMAAAITRLPIPTDHLLTEQRQGLAETGTAFCRLCSTGEQIYAPARSSGRSSGPVVVSSLCSCPVARIVRTRYGFNGEPGRHVHLKAIEILYDEEPAGRTRGTRYRRWAIDAAG